MKMIYCAVLVILAQAVLGFPVDNSEKPCDFWDLHGKPSYLWRIDAPGASKPSYLFGTVHVPVFDVLAMIPDNSKLAFIHSDVAVFEIDTTQKALDALQSCPDLPEGVTIQDVIPPAMYQRIVKHFEFVREVFGNWTHEAVLKTANVTSEELFERETASWETKKPVWLAMMLQLYNEQMVKNRYIASLDMYLSFMGKHSGKKIESWGSVQERCDYWDSLTPEQAIFHLNTTLSLYETMQTTGNHNPQDLGYVDKYTCLNVPEEKQPYLIDSEELIMAAEMSSNRYENLIIKRNTKMATRISNSLINNPDKSYFFAFTLEHLTEENSIPNQLAAIEGFKVARQSAHFNAVDLRQIKEEAGKKDFETTIVKTRTKRSIIEEISFFF